MLSTSQDSPNLSACIFKQVYLRGVEGRVLMRGVGGWEVGILHTVRKRLAGY
jgi:hypothetical protein